jgi:hypothetical protein
MDEGKKRLLIMAFGAFSILFGMSQLFNSKTISSIIQSPLRFPFLLLLVFFVKNATFVLIGIVCILWGIRKIGSAGTVIFLFLIFLLCLSLGIDHIARYWGESFRMLLGFGYILISLFFLLKFYAYVKS